MVDRNRKQIIIINKSVEHPSTPSKPNTQRVHEYWSCMVIHSTSSSLRTPGVEYVLTYFEDPGVALPQKVQSWVAQKQMPEYLHRLHFSLRLCQRTTPTAARSKSSPSQRTTSKSCNSKYARQITGIQLFFLCSVSNGVFLYAII